MGQGTKGMQFIILMGPKHSGKTSAGRELAKRLHCGFTDLDEAITLRCGESPRSLYEKGSEFFKKAETETLAALLDQEQTNSPSAVPPLQVMAAGGGIIDNDGAIKLIQNNPEIVTVYIDVCAQTAWERINKEKELPPFLGTINPRETHLLLHERRAEAYRRFASATVKAENRDPSEIACEISILLNQ